VSASGRYFVVSGWTEADQAELDYLIFRLVEAGWAHRSCARCRALGTWCPPMRTAGEGVLEWRRGRALKSRADALRELQENGSAAE